MFNSANEARQFFKAQKLKAQQSLTPQAQPAEKGKGQVVYRSTKTPFESGKIGEEGIFVSPDKSWVEHWGESQKRDIVEELIISPKANILKRKNIPDRFITKEDGWDVITLDNQKALIEFAKEKGYDGYENYSISPSGNISSKELAIFNPDVISLTPTPEAGKVEGKPAGKGEVAKAEYTSTPVEWNAENDLYDWGQKGLRAKGNQKIGNRKTFVWQNEFQQVPVRLPKATTDAFRARTDEVFKVHNRKGDDYYLVPPKVVEQVKLELGEDALKARPKPERSPMQQINDAINSAKRHDLEDAEIGAFVEDYVKELGLTKEQYTDNINKYIKALENDPEANTIRKSFQKGVEQAVQPTGEEIEERLGIQEQGLAEEIGDFLDGIVEKETPQFLETEPHKNQKDLFGGEKPILRAGKGRQGGFLTVPRTPSPEALREGAEKIYQNAINRFASIENATKKAQKLGMEIKPGENPGLRARSYLGLGRKVESVLQDKTSMQQNHEGALSFCRVTKNSWS